MWIKNRSSGLKSTFWCKIENFVTQDVRLKISVKIEVLVKNRTFVQNFRYIENHANISGIYLN